MTNAHATTGLLRAALLAGVAYFVCMSGAHFFGFKQPVLFVYYDTPYYAYQDKIIAFCCATYVVLFWTAARHLVAVPAAIFSMATTAAGLSLVNSSDALAGVLREGQGTAAYWAQTALIAVYAVALAALYASVRTPPEKKLR